MDSKQKAVDNITNYLHKRIERNERKLLDYRDREKVYGFRYENKKDVIHAENEFIDNLLPSCRMCNFYKSTFTLEEFRKNLETLHERLRKPFIYRLALKYGLIEEHKKDVVFYFER